jgi:hypothetical protein
MSLEKSGELFLFCFCSLIILGSFGFIVTITWYSEHTLEGVLARIRAEGFGVEQVNWGSKPSYVELNQTIWRTHRLDDFIYLAKTYGWYSISMHSYIDIVYWEPHYADTHPFYSIWFSNRTTIFLYTYNPEQGTGDM